MNIPQPELLDRAGIQAIYDNHELVYGIPERPGLMKSADGQILKIYYRLPGISKATFFPQAPRFIRNSQFLAARDVAAPQVSRWIRCQDPAVDLLFYPQLPGLDFRQLCSEGQVRLLEQLATQLAGLHHKGIYFRAIHLGNLLHQESEGLALLDISDLYVRNRPLRLLLRARNILHLIRARQDRQYFESFGPDRFIAEYLQASGLSAWRAAIVRNRILVGLRFGKT